MDCAPCMLNARSAVASTIVRDFGLGVFLVSDKDEDRCDEIMEKVASEDRGITTDDSPTRLQSIWLSQQCETRAGPEHVIRKYSFFANGTFLLIRYHYAEESCSIATYAVVARGSIELSSPSIRISGATETNARLDSVHLIPFNRQVARRFRRRINATCAVDDTEEIKWRPYRAEPIYKRPIHVPADMNVNLHGPSSNSFESRSRRTKNRDAFDCLEMLNIEFAELGLLRVEKRRSRVELLLGGSLRSTRLSETFGTRTPSRLQSLALLRADTLVFCPICVNVLRATQYSPPLFHQAPTLPVEIGGLWVSVRCESVDRGFWARRIFRIYSNENRWSARWTYYTDFACSIPSCAVMATGTYARTKQPRSRSLDSTPFMFFDRVRFRFDEFGESSRGSRKDSNLYLRIFRVFQTKRPFSRSRRCLPQGYVDYSKTSAIPTFKARINLDWNGDYTLLLASSKDDVWEAPLRRCSNAISSNNFRAKSCARDPKSWQESSFSLSSEKLSVLYNRFFQYPIVLFFACWLYFLPFRNERTIPSLPAVVFQTVCLLLNVNPVSIVRFLSSMAACIALPSISST
ncbi:protein APCDD1 isoform X2 [Lasioglossum baleicum]|uniref:protein APCDD1 isoform X2 n=1 Tax=Lasioglossum baleicum TaxID=434251 RepID=UPI003FCC4A93